MKYHSPLSNLNKALEAVHCVYNSVAYELLDLNQADLDHLIAVSFGTIASSSAVGYRIGEVIKGAPGAATGALVGACVGIVIVIGAVAYRIYFQRVGGKIILARIEAA